MDQNLILRVATQNASDIQAIVNTIGIDKLIQLTPYLLNVARTVAEYEPEPGKRR